MSWPTIVKSASVWGPTAPNLRDYAQARAEFSWALARRELDGLPGGRGLNIAHEAVDRHAVGPQRHRVAIRWLGAKGEVREYTYGELANLTNRFANVLRALGAGAGTASTVWPDEFPNCTSPRSARSRIAACSVRCSRPSGLSLSGSRMATGRARVLVTTESLYRRKVAGLRGMLSSLEHVLLVGGGQSRQASPGPPTITI